MADLIDRMCKDLPTGTPALSVTEVAALKTQLHADWAVTGQVSDQRLTRRFEVKGYRKALMLANAGGFLAERENHHPDIAFGYGWCEVTFWTHTVGGLSDNDFICAAKLDAMVAGF